MHGNEISYDRQSFANSIPKQLNMFSKVAWSKLQTVSSASYSIISG